MTGQQTPDRIEDLAQQFSDAIFGKGADLLSSHIRWLWPSIWRILADGRPASTAEIAELSGRSAADIADIIAHTAEVEADRDGRVLGAALTLIPTPHRVLLADRAHQLYLWCVPDALIVSRLLDRPLRVASPCHATGRDINLEVEPDRVRAVDPPSAVMAFVTECDPSDLRGTVCVHQNLFVSAEAAEPWLEGHAQAFTVPADDAHRIMEPVITGSWFALQTED